jgi:hypothetical protein
VSRRPRRRASPQVVRRVDALGRVYYAERASGQRTSKRAWTIDVERRKRPLPKKPVRPTKKDIEDAAFERIAKKEEQRAKRFPGRPAPIDGPQIGHEPDVRKQFPPGISRKGAPEKPPVMPPEIDLSELDPETFAVEGQVRTP